MNNNQLSYTCEERVKFSDVDSMRIMWHGHYLKLFEEGREQFGLKYGLDYLKIYNHGFFTPIVASNIKHLHPLAYGDTAVIECNFEYTPAAKIIFNYKIYSKNSGKLCATGSTTQVFLNKEYKLEITNPPYFQDWKEKYFKNG